MKKYSKILRVILILALLLQMLPAAVYADSAVDDAVAKLNAVDTLQQMQNKRSACATKEEYQTYLDDMFAKRADALAVYDALTDEQKAEVRTQVADLDEKLKTELPTVWLFSPGSITLTTGSAIYPYEVIFKDYTCYEASYHHAVSGDVAQTIMLVDTDAVTSLEWEPTPEYEYKYGESNYLLTYCCDLVIPTRHTARYRRLNLEDAGYYNEDAAEHIRAIVQNSYPFVSLEEMKQSLKAAGFEDADDLNRGEVIAAVQMAIWRYANADDGRVSDEALAKTTHDDGLFNYSKVLWCNPYHDYRNEVWDWWKTSAASTPDPDAAAKVNKLTDFIYNTPGIKADPNQIVISDIEIVDAQLKSESEGVYQMEIKVSLNGVSQDGGNVTLTASSGTGAPVTKTVSATEDTYVMTLEAKDGDTITVTADGTQKLSKGVYFYDPELNLDLVKDVKDFDLERDKYVSQCLVGVAEGTTKVYAERSVTWTDLSPKGVPPEPTPTPDPKPDPKPDPTPEPEPEPEPELPPEEPAPDETISDDDTPQAAPDDIEEEDDISEKDDNFGGLEEEEDLEDEETPLSPFTGDARNTGLWGLISLLSLAGIAAIAAADRRRAK